MKRFCFMVLAALTALVYGCVDEPQYKPAAVSVNPTELSFEMETGEQAVVLNSNRDWTSSISSSEGTADWITLSQSSGKASDKGISLTVTVLPNSAEGSEDRSAVITFTGGTQSATLKVSQLGQNRKSYTTIAEFLAAPVDQSTWYELQGTITNIKNTDYGNITIKDETGSVYIHGLTATQQTKNDKSFSSLGLKVTDVVVLKTLRGEYNGEAQGGGDIPAYYISHEPGNGGSTGGDDNIGENWKKAAVSAFGDDFQSIKTAKIKYVTDNWTFWSSDASDIYYQFKTSIYNTDEKYIDIAPFGSSAASVTAFAMLPKANVSAASPKQVEFEVAFYHKDAADGSKFEVVVSKDFNGSFTDATWTVVYDATSAADAELNKWNKHTADLSGYASDTELFIAFRYTGKTDTYRLDNVKFGTPDNMNGGNEEDKPVDPGDVEGVEGDGVYTSNVGLPTADNSGDASYNHAVIVDGKEYPALKLGTGKKGGTYTTPALTVTGSKLSFYAVAWNNGTCKLTVTINGGGTINGKNSVSVNLNPNSGVNNQSPYTVTFGKDFYVLDLAGITSSTTFTFSTEDSGPRCVVTGANVR